MYHTNSKDNKYALNNFNVYLKKKKKKKKKKKNDDSAQD